MREWESEAGKRGKAQGVKESVAVRGGWTQFHWGSQRTCVGHALELFPHRDGRWGHLSTECLGAAPELLGTCSVATVPQPWRKVPGREDERRALQVDSSLVR